MDSVAVTVPLRQPGKKMKKRKELDALAPPHAISRRSSGKRSSQELLTDSSDDRSEYWNVSMRNGRKCRGRRSQACPGFLKACSAFLACAPVLATASLIWLFIDVRQQLTALRSELDQVIAGSEGIPDALQKYHSLSRDLQNNQTIIFSHISDLKLQINNFTTQLSGIQHNLHQVQEWFQAAPELANVPKNLNSLSTSVASFGSQIQDLRATVNTLKETNVRVQDAQATMQQNISSIKHSLVELSNITQRPQMLITNETKIKTDELNTAISRLAHNLSRINENLTMTLNWTAEDEKKDHAMLVSFQDSTQDLRMKVLSLQTECAKATDLADLLNSLNKLTEQMKMMRETNTELATRIKQLEQLYSNLRNSTTMMSSVISEIRGQQQIIKVKESDDNENTTTETHNGATDTEAAQTKSSTGKPNYLADNRK